MDNAPTGPRSSRTAWQGWALAIAGLLFAAGAALGLWRAAHRPLAVSADAAEAIAAPVPANVAELQQALANARKSDEISRAANADLQKTLAERDTEIAGLKADIAFYQRFMGASTDRRPLAVQGLELQPQAGNVWHFEAMVAQNTQRDGNTSGKLRLAVEGTQAGKLHKLEWGDLRQAAGSEGLPYDFKYFQRVEGDIALPAGFTPTRVLTRLQPPGGTVVENSFAWQDVVAAH